VSEYHTKHQGLAALLLFVLGDAAHVGTRLADAQRGVIFVFTDDPPGSCEGIAKEFFSEQGAIVANARALLECGRAIRERMNDCLRSSGWGGQ
jgi:hypothetical protein